jgi:hypothetical protein
MPPLPKTSLLIALLALVLPASAAPSNIDSIYYFYERTLYLEDLTQVGSWWSNPSKIASIRTPCVFTSNTGLLGGKYSLSSIRILFPVQRAITAGFGLTGAGTKEVRSFSGNSSGATASGNFNFSRPSIEGGISYHHDIGGTVGGLLMTGTESTMPDFEGIRKYYFILGAGFGYLSPLLADAFQLSLSTISVCHFQVDTWWDHGAKTGAYLNIGDGFVIGSFEYGFSLLNAFAFLRNQRTAYSYEVFKGTISTRFRSIAGFILGCSSDTKNQRDNGPTFHGGLELRPSEIYPFWGGYEIGVSPWSSRHQTTSAVITVIHRFWIGYNFKKTDLNRQTSYVYGNRLKD